MRKKLLALAMIMTISVTGCNGKQASDGGDVTLESLAADVAEKEADITSFSMDMDINLGMDVKVSEDSTGTAVRSTGTIEAFVSPEFKSKANMTMEMKVLGMMLPVETEQYTVMEDGKCVSYIKTEGQDWTKTESDAYARAIQSQIDQTIFRAVQEGTLTGTLADATEEINGKECHVVDVQVTGDYINNLISQVIGPVTGGSEMNWEKYSTTVRYYIDAGEKLPVKVSMDIADMATQAFGETDLGTDIQISECTADLIFNSYNNVEDFQLPEDAQNAKDAGDTINDLLQN